MLNKSKKRGIRRNGKYFLLTLPMMILVFIFSYIPMGGLVIAFKKYNYQKGIFGSEWAGFKNFEFLFKNPDLYRIIKNTLGYNLVFIIFTPIIAVGIALLLNEITSKKVLKFYQTTMFIPYFLSWVIISYIAYSFLNPRLGYVNAIATTFGMQNLDWYNTPDSWIFIIIFSNMWKTIGMNVLMYYASLMSIDPSYYEAATIEGASKFQVTMKITLPFLYPLIIILSLLAIGKIFNSDFGLFYQLPMDSKTLYKTTDVLETYVFRALMVNGNISMSSAAGFIKSTVGLLMVMITNGIVKKVNPDYSLY